MEFKWNISLFMLFYNFAKICAKCLMLLRLSGIRDIQDQGGYGSYGSGGPQESSSPSSGSGNNSSKDLERDRDRSAQWYGPSLREIIDIPDDFLSQSQVSISKIIISNFELFFFKALLFIYYKNIIVLSLWGTGFEALGKGSQGISLNCWKCDQPSVT